MYGMAHLFNYIGGIKMAYEFFSGNSAGIDNISGNQYIELLEFCFQYSNYFSLTFLHPQSGTVNMRLGSEKMEQLDPYIYDSFETKDEPWYFEGPNATIKIFYNNEKTKQIILDHTNSLYEWSTYEHRNPEDLSFFRSDGSVLFHLLEHEGLATIYNNDYEIVPEFALKTPWKSYNPDPDIIPLVYTAKRIKKQKLSIKQKTNFKKLVSQKNRPSRPGWKKKQ